MFVNRASSSAENQAGQGPPQLAHLAAITPAVLLMGCFFLAPALWAIYVSTTSLSLTDLTAINPEFVGLDNYRRLWSNPDFPKFLRNTVVFTVGAAVVGETIGGLAIALLLKTAQQQGYRLATLAFSAVLLAGICPPTVAGTIWGGIFDYRNGTLNTLLEWLHSERVDMLGRFPMLAVIIAESWRGLAFAMVIFYAALHTIPNQLYEASSIDGGNRWSQFRDITIPALEPVGMLVLLMTSIMTMGSFLTILVLTNGDPAFGTETIALNAYHTAFRFFDIGYGAALSVVMLAVTASLTIPFALISRQLR